MELKDFQKEQAIACFNKTWDYIDMAERSAKDDLEMIHCAHTSRYLWGLVGTPLHHERGEWQVAKVYTLLGKGEQALYHAQNCLDICLAEGIADFDLAFAYEGMANAHKVLGNTDLVKSYKEKALIAAESIEKAGDKDYTLGEIAKI